MKFVNDFKMLPTRDKFSNELQSILYKIFQHLADIFKNLKLEDNFDGEILEVSDSGNADSEITIAHHLKRIPKYFIVISINKGAVVYKSSTSWTETNIYLKCNVANTAFKVFIW